MRLEGYVDTTEALRAESKRIGAWVHFRVDAHPTEGGHTVIARTIAGSSVFASYQAGH
jgi:hypothetical protein